MGVRVARAHRCALGTLRYSSLSLIRQSFDSMFDFLLACSAQSLISGPSPCFTSCNILSFRFQTTPAPEPIPPMPSGILMMAFLTNQPRLRSHPHQHVAAGNTHSGVEERWHGCGFWCDCLGSAASHHLMNVSHTHSWQPTPGATGA